MTNDDLWMRVGVGVCASARGKPRGPWTIAAIYASAVLAATVCYAASEKQYFLLGFPKVATIWFVRAAGRVACHSVLGDRQRALPNIFWAYL